MARIIVHEKTMPREILGEYKDKNSERILSVKEF
jgi:hypothetical protein